ncbi:D-alanyl-D-alanine carboxypeptidase/D-alanyl-D-alanine endopeptidase [Billgrantia gudaonensis]|uniref:D-alanyl-D-alanine carboxypeptidase / D-alanyl-D-alanine-endopeptidase (Penicillin-binding protein 4) n=1 Tax=Billgrantia gudaonensis TaxID=376427 RepID=A0A1G8Z813_9GAMM|nr:D-alanyl-D-alanine carboxypeptidase/D-alanyl-D-alanine-endopeptidase [Halomonas gudaonensis]SDK10340.1 D-alanyl-D-alanine carboxypeptidase / D-alanyl-D-alanine-endopeptidase (penicillin-binding protein 4) [Halomonas gudaonensis]
MACRLLLAVVLLWLPLAAPAAGFTELGRLAERGFLIGAEARLLDSGEVLGSLAPQRQLSPASVSKLYLAAAALDRWGPQHRFTTRLVSDAELDAEGRLHGDLVFEGSGDPGLATEDLWRLAQRLHQRGVREVNGRLVISQWRFGPVACLTTDRCEGRERVANTYSALLSAAGINHGNWCVNVAPGREAQAPARVTHCDGQASLVTVDNQVITLAAGGATALDAERVTRDGEDVMVLRGTIAGDAAPRDVYRTSGDPAEQTARTLAAMLDQVGIAVQGIHATTIEPPSASADTLAAVEGRPLQALLLDTLHYSNNFMADMLTLGLADTPRPTLLDGAEAIEHFVAGIPDHGPLDLRSGSGLTPESRTSARGVNALLASLFHRPSLFPAFVGSLQTPSNGVMRFLRRGSPVFQNRVMLKTGTLNQPVAVRAVGGYFRTRTGRWGVFSALVNGTATTPWLNWTQVLDPLTEDIERMIETN